MGAEPASAPGRSITPLLVGAFYCLASLICAVAGVSLFLPRGGFDWTWIIKSVNSIDPSLSQVL